MSLKNITKGIIGFSLLCCLLGCDFLSSQQAIDKYRNKIVEDSVLLNEFIRLSGKIENDSITYTIRPTRAGMAAIEESKGGGTFLNNDSLNNEEYKRNLYKCMDDLNTSYVQFEKNKSVIFGFPDRNCGWYYFELIYFKDTTNVKENFKEVLVYENTDSLPKRCGNWIYKLSDRWILYSE